MVSALAIGAKSQGFSPAKSDESLKAIKKFAARLPSEEK
jgi:hypothetical protein